MDCWADLLLVVLVMAAVTAEAAVALAVYSGQICQITHHPV